MLLVRTSIFPAFVSPTYEQAFAFAHEPLKSTNQHGQADNCSAMLLFHSPFPQHPMSVLSPREGNRNHVTYHCLFLQFLKPTPGVDALDISLLCENRLDQA